METHTHVHALTHAHTHTHTHAHNDYSRNWVLILVGVEILWKEEGFQWCHFWKKSGHKCTTSMLRGVKTGVETVQPQNQRSEEINRKWTEDASCHEHIENVQCSHLLASFGFAISIHASVLFSCFRFDCHRAQSPLFQRFFLFFFKQSTVHAVKHHCSYCCLTSYWPLQ